MRAVNQPESWWGWHGWNQPEALSIIQIMQAGTLPPRMAAAFWLGIERGASFMFAAEPPGAGKTTILTALLPFAREETVAYFTRGWGETFDLPPPSDDYPTYLMINEMSDHLPVYSWGPYVVECFRLLSEGYSLLSTLHAETIDEILEQLIDDNDADPEHVAKLTFVVPMVVENREGGTLRRIRDVGLLRHNGAKIETELLATWDAKADTFSVLDDEASRQSLAERLGMELDAFEAGLAKRETFLQRLLDEGQSSIAVVEEAVAAFKQDG
jgi:hypothetical protein